MDTPLEMRVDASNKKAYLLCDYNRDGDSHRSPWSNTYEPALSDEGFKPSAPLRELEVAANELLEVYCGLYYGGGSAHSGDTVASSAYFWQLDDVGPAAFGSCWLVKKGERHLMIRPLGSCWLVMGKLRLKFVDFS